MTQLIMDHRDLIRAVVLEGPYDPRHWASVLAVGTNPSQSIPVLGDLRSNSTKSIYDAVKDQDDLTIHTGNREVRINPSLGEQEAFEHKIEEQTAKDEVLGEWNKKEAKTSDGVPAPLSYVLGSFPDDQQINHINETAGGDVGLFRSELLFEKEDLLENEEKLASRFAELAKGLKGTLRVRAIDRKPGDKQTIFDRQPGGDQGELKWLLENERGREVFRKFCRVMLRAYAALDEHHKNIEFFIPMVERREQVEQALAILAAEKETLRRELNRPDEKFDMKFGVMIETKLEPKNLEEIISDPGVSFISIGTRDLAVHMSIKDVIVADYLQTVRKIIETSVKHGKGVSICGLHAANESFITWVFSLPIPDDKLPTFAVLGGSLAGIKAFVRRLSRQNLRSSIKGDFGKRQIKRTHAKTRAAQAQRERELVQSEEFEERLHRQLIQQGPVKSLWGDFIKGIGSLLSVKVEAPAHQVPLSKAGKLGFDFTYLLPAARLVASSLQYAAENGNSLVVYLVKIGISWVDRAILGRDTRSSYVVVGSEGHRTGKEGQGALPVNAELGFGKNLHEVLLPSIESPEGLMLKDKTGTVVGRVYGEPGALGKIPDAYMFKIAASRELSGIDLKDIINRARVKGSAIDLAEAARSMFRKSQNILNRAPSMGVLLRPRHQVMIEALLSELRINRAFSEIQSEVEKSSTGFMDFQSDSGSMLRVYAYDDWSAGLSISNGKVLDFYMGVSGTPETKMSAVLAKKLGGQVAATFVPHDNKPSFLFSELAGFSRQGLKKDDLQRTYSENDLIPGNPEDIACTISVLQNFQWGKKEQAAGPVVQDDGNVEVIVLWVGDGKITPVKMTFRTIASSLLSKIKKTPNSADAKRLATAWVEFGRYDQSAGLVKEWKIKTADAPLESKQWSVMELFVLAGEVLTKGMGTPESLAVQAIGLYQQALKIVESEKELAYLKGRNVLGLNQRVRRLSYWLRDRAVRLSETSSKADRTAFLAEALRHSDEVLVNSDRGFEVRIEDNKLRLKDIVDEYRHWFDEEWAIKQIAPSMKERLEAAFEAAYNHRENKSITDYKEWLEAHHSNLETALLIATALSDEPLDAQARFVRFFSSSLPKIKLTSGIDLEQDFEKLERDEFVQAVLNLWGKSEMNMAWQESRLALARTNRILVRPEIERILPNMETRPNAHKVVSELILAAMAKADIMPGLGNVKGRLAYLQDADLWARLLDEHPRMLGEMPLPLLFDLSLLYAELLSETGDAQYKAKMEKYLKIVSDDASFVEFLRSIKDSSEHQIHSDEKIMEWNMKRGVLVDDHHKLLADSSGGKVVNSILFYVGILFHVKNPQRLITPGYALEAAAALALIFSKMGSFSGVLAGFAAVHVILWLLARVLARGQPSISLVRLLALSLGRFGLHLLGFLPYLFADHIYLASGPNEIFWLVFSLAALSHLLFDTLLPKMWESGEDLTEAQRRTYETVLHSLGAKDSSSGGSLSLDVTTIVPGGLSQKRYAGFLAALREAVWRAARGTMKFFGPVLEAALGRSKGGPILLFVNDDTNLGLIDQVFQKAAQQKRGILSPAILVIGEEAFGSEAELQTRLDILRGQYPDVRFAYKKAGRDFFPQRDAYHYEDMFAAFKYEPALKSEAPLLELLSGDGKNIPSDFRIVQINTPMQKYLGNENLLSLILLLLPVSSGAVLLDFKEVLAAAKYA